MPYSFHANLPINTKVSVKMEPSYVKVEDQSSGSLNPREETCQRVKSLDGLRETLSAESIIELQWLDDILKQ